VDQVVLAVVHKHNKLNFMKIDDNYHEYRGWYWKSLDLTTIDDEGCKSRHFQFVKIDEEKNIIESHDYPWRCWHIENYTDEDMAKMILNAAILCNYWD